ncbi:hypothetical protein [Dehalogenimonas etheniformans]|uniref:Uncharacterized protein n=1 Tax=Dehalogenimonas etheniformans TaxID=1536648 RepID=A0A2P5PA50_9CHLR|nr:hypothetical protein [Dehalogenimonas etheniformans]PPD59172.1 hypothetical protein JP09_000385 [Dehalogenimonas etheniformans]QNT75787.1 hypothetical protein HX448_03335 [Dehalogenimonas etheniformans]
MTTGGSSDVLGFFQSALAELTGRAEKGRCELTRLGRRAESLKVTCLISSLEAQRMALARQRAWTALSQQPGSFENIVGNVLINIISVGTTIDKPSEGLSYMLENADRSLRRYGEADWMVSIGRT